MKTITGFFITLLIIIGLGLGGIQEVQAKRFGGARSFGSKPAYSMPYRRSVSKPQRSASQQQAYQKNQAARQTLSRRGGLMGLLGGLALGGLLGSLFFGGAFEGLNFMDILVFGGLAFLLYKLFSARARPSYQADAYDNNASASPFTQAPDTCFRQTADFDTDVLFNKKTRQPSQSLTGQDADFDNAVTPAGFDKTAFLEGAKSAFRQLQTAWNNADLAEIRGLTTDKVFAEIQQQLKSEPNQNFIDVLKVDAELLDFREIGQEQEAVVLFDAILREQYDAQAEQVREIWHFVKSKNSLQPTWYLDGIQQLES